MDRARDLVTSLARTGGARKVFANEEIILIAKNIGGVRKVLFIPRGKYVLLYIKTVTLGNVATIWGWDGKVHSLAATIDFNDIPTPDDVASIEISESVGGNGFLYFRSAQSLIEPPFAEYPIAVNGRKSAVSPWRSLVYAGSPINFRQLHRGVDRDLFYTTTDGIFYGDDTGAAIHERLWSDVTREITLRYTLPTPTAGTVWPAVGFDRHFSRYLSVVGNAVWVIATNGIPQSYIEFWKLSADATTFSLELLFTNNYAGGSSQREYGSLFYNTVNDEMGLAVSEHLDTAGDPSDLELVYSIDGVLIAEFEPKTSMGYAARTMSNRSRISRAWVVRTGVYAVQIENTTQPVAVIDQCADGVFLVDATGETTTVTKVYQASAGVGMRAPIVNPYRPQFVLCGEKNRHSTADQQVFLLNVLTGATVVVETGTNLLTSSQFVS